MFGPIGYSKPPFVIVGESDHFFSPVDYKPNLPILSRLALSDITIGSLEPYAKRGDSELLGTSGL